MHARRRREVIAGRGPVGKTAVVGVKDRASNKRGPTSVGHVSCDAGADGGRRHTARSGGLHRRAPLL